MADSTAVNSLDSSSEPQAIDGLPVQAPIQARQGWHTAVSTTVTGLGYELIEVERAQRGLLRVTIDRIPGKPYGSAEIAGLAPINEFITVEDCEKVTRQLQYALEVEGMDYARLEVSSPGLDRLLRHEADFQRFTGELVDIALKLAFQNRKTWRGILQPAPLAVAGSGAGAAVSDTAAGWQLLIKEGKTEQVLNFQMNEVREVRLHPVVNFKGRGSGKADGAEKSAAGTAGSGSRSTRQQPGVAHGSDEAQDVPTPDGG